MSIKLLPPPPEALNKLHVRVSVQQHVLAYLMARQAVAARQSLDSLHEEFVNEISQAIAKVAGPGAIAQEGEALLTAELDRLFSLASMHWRRLLDRSDPRTPEV